MSRRLHIFMVILITCCLASLLSQTALAAGDYRTVGNVNLRSGPSTDTRIITTLPLGAVVDVTEYNPDGWSKVTVGGSSGYIRSDLLVLHAAGNPASGASGASGITVYTTKAGVNFRSGPSTNADVIKLIATQTKVEMIEYNPAGWSKVVIDKATGFIRSDLLIVTNEPATAALPPVVAPPDTTTPPPTVAPPPDTAALPSDTAAPPPAAALPPDTAEPPASDIPLSDAPAAEPPAGESLTGESLANNATLPEDGQMVKTVIYKTTDGVNFRTGPSTSASIVRTLLSGSYVEMLEYDPDGWSKVKERGVTGYIKSEYLAEDFTSLGKEIVELLYWEDAIPLVPTGVALPIIDVRTGIMYDIRCFSKGMHADVEPITKADTAAILESRDGVWAWDPRPVWVFIGERVFAASLNGQPHDVGTIPDNGMNGHLCLHFNGTITNNKSYERDLNNAVIEAWKAGQTIE